MPSGVKKAGKGLGFSRLGGSFTRLQEKQIFGS